jgi:uncharacterized protein YdeI (YjbR/CyaY-like superfamily)
MMKPVFFNTQKDFREWLIKNHDKETEIWIGMWKKASGKIGLDYNGALEEALCFGWIDGIARKFDEESYMQRFTPRRPKSIWSKINVGHIERLTKLGKMMPSGVAAVEAAKKDGRWDAAYDSPKSALPPKEFFALLAQYKKAEEFYNTLSKSNTYAIAWRIQTAKKEETRQRRMNQIVEMLERGEKFH